MSKENFTTANICSDDILKALADSENKWKSLIQNCSDMITLLTVDGIVEFESPSITKIVGFNPEELVGRNIFNFIHPHDLPSTMSAFTEVVMNPASSKTVEFRFQHKDGSWRYLEAIGQSMLNISSVKSIVINSRDITERRLTEEKLYHQAMYDSLTKLPNRYHLLKRLEEIFNYAKQESNYTFAILYLDIDRFKIINDSLGHSVGDELLFTVSRRLENCIRSEDIIGRLGGDEFIIILNNIANNNDVELTSLRITSALSQVYKLSGSEIYNDISIGIAFYDSKYDEYEQLIRNADIALYRAKSLGGSCHIVFDDVMHAELINSVQLENDLRQADKHNNFFVEYQPIYNLETNLLAGFEALIRWKCSKRGIVMPCEFIPVAEQSGLIVSIGYWVFQEVCKQIHQWKKQFPSFKIKISINCSARQFMHIEFLDKIIHFIEKNQINNSDIVIEITESVLMEDTAHVTSVFSKLTALGIDLCMDDFGTGYSSLNYLHRYPIKSLKIDRSFVKNINNGKKQKEIIKAILTMASELGINVIAEGIDSNAILNELAYLKCKFGQGYYFDKPLLSVDATILIQNQSLKYFDSL